MFSQSGVTRYGTVIVIAVLIGGSYRQPIFAQSEDPFVPVTDAMLQAPSDNDWLMWRRTFNGWGL